MAEGIQIEKTLPLWLRDVVGGPQRAREYLGEIRAEMRRVTWPARQEVYGTTVVVIVTVFVFGLYFFVVDFGLHGAMEEILERLRGLL
jgi:preprotein translocase subunit SecE